MLDATAAASTEVDVAETSAVGAVVEEVDVAVGSTEVEEAEGALAELGVSRMISSAAGIVEEAKGATVVDVVAEVSVIKDDDEVSGVADTVTVAVEVEVSVAVIVLVYPALVLDGSGISSFVGTNFIWTLSASAR